MRVLGPEGRGPPDIGVGKVAVMVGVAWSLSIQYCYYCTATSYPCSLRPLYFDCHQLTIGMNYKQNSHKTIEIH